MKYKVSISVLLFLGLFALMTPTAMAATTLVSTLANDGVANVAPGDSVVVAAFKVVESGTGAESIAKFRLVGSGTIDDANVKSVGVYWDVNENGTFQAGIDVLQVGASQADVATWNGATVDLTLPAAFAIPKSATRYFIVVCQVAKAASAATQATFDGTTLKSTANTINSTTDVGTVSAASANRTVAVTATHLKWNPVAILDRVVEGGATEVLDTVTMTLTGTTTVLEAVDDYGNRDLGITGVTAEVDLTTLKYADLTAGPAVTATNGLGTDADTSGDNLGHFTNGAMVYDDVSIDQFQTIQLAVGTDNVVLVATLETTGALGGIRGTISVEREGAATTLNGSPVNRGVEFYDYDHNGQIDHATFFFNSPINYDANNKAWDGVTVIPISAFSVVGYTIPSTSFALVNQDMGGVGVNNAGPFGVTITLNESGTPDTGARPQAQYNASVSPLKFLGSAVSVTSIGPGDATEYDKARPILLTKKTVDANNDGFVDGIELTFSESVTPIASPFNSAKVAADPTTFTFALKSTDQNGSGISETFPANVNTTFTNNGNTLTIPVTSGTSVKNTGFWPILIYSQGYATYLLTDSQLNEFIADASTNVTGGAADIAINIDDGVAAQVVSLTTNDTDGNGKIDKIAVEFSENMDNSPFFTTGVTFDSGVATFGTNGIYTPTATARSLISQKVINFTITESGAGVYDTEAKPVFKFDQTGKLGSAHFTKAAKYGPGQVVPSISASQVVDGAAPKIVSATTDDQLIGTTSGANLGDIAGAALGPDGWIDTFTIVFSEGISIGNKSSGYTDARAAVQSMSINVGATTLNVAGADVGNAAQDNLFDNDTSPATTNPTLSNATTGDQQATLVIHFDQATAARGWYNGAGIGWNGGDTGVKPDILYTATANNYITDVAGNTLENIAAGTVTERDGAAPRISTSSPPQTMDFFGQVASPSEDNGDGDGYIDSFKIFFTEKVKVPDATAIGGFRVWTSYNSQTGGPTGAADTDSSDDRENAITLNIGVDANADTDVTFPDVSTAPAITAADNATAANYKAAYDASAAPTFFFDNAVFYGTSAKRTTTGDTQMLPRIWYDGTTAITDTTGVSLATMTAATVSGGAYVNGVQAIDKAAPVIMRATGIQGKNEINVQMSEQVDLGGTDFGSAIPAQETGNVFGYENVDAAVNATLAGSGTGYVVYRDSDKSLLKLYTTSNLTASDIANDLIWPIAGIQDKATAPNTIVNKTDGIRQASPKASIKIHIDDVSNPFVSEVRSIDLDGDGWIDYFMVTFNKPIKSATIPGYAIDNIVSESIIDIAGYTGEKFTFFTTAATAAAKGEEWPGNTAFVANGTVVYIKVDERSAGPNAITGIGDTGATPAITYNFPTTLTDMEETPVGNVLNVAAAVDKVGPVIMSAAQISSTQMEITFSEDINGATLQAAGFDWRLVNYPQFDGFDELQKFVTMSGTIAETNAGKAMLTLPAAKALPAGVAQSVAFYAQLGSGVVAPAAASIIPVKDLAANIAGQVAGAQTLATSAVSVTLLGASGTSVAVIAPNGGENLAVGQATNITWTATNVANVKIESSVDGGATWTTIVATVPATPAVYAWTPAAAMTNVRIKVTDAAGTANDMSDQAFSVGAGSVPPVLPAVSKASLNPVPSNLPDINNNNVTKVKFSGAASAADTIKVSIVDKAGAMVDSIVVANSAGNFSGMIDASSLANGMVTIKAGKAVGGVVTTWFTGGDYLKETIVIGAPSAVAVTDVPNDQGGFVNLTFATSANHEGKNSSDWYTVDYYGLQVQKAKSATDTTKVWVNVSTFKPAKLEADGIQRQNGVWIGTDTTVPATFRMYAHAAPSGTAKLAADMPDAMFSPFSDVASGSAIDNVVPGNITTVKADGSAGSGVVLNWTVPADHGIYNAEYNIWGVDKYDVYRKGATGDYAVVGTVNPGVLTYTDNVANGANVYDYMVKAVDGSQIVASTSVKGMASKGPDFNGDGTVGLGDLVLLGNLWGFKSTDTGFITNFDLNKDLAIGLGDLVLLGNQWGKAPAKSAPAAGVELAMTPEFNQTNSVYYVTVSTKEALQGVAFTLNYDANLYEFVSDSITGLGSVSIANELEAGSINVASVYGNDAFSGAITLGFKSKGAKGDMNVQMVNAEVLLNGVFGSVNGQTVTLKAVPTTYSLAQNFPNPFNPTTTIEYSLPTAGHTTLAIYNIAGQKIRTLINDVQAPSYYKVVWNGKNDSGMTVASGTYFCKLVSGNYSKIVTMKLLK